MDVVEPKQNGHLQAAISTLHSTCAALPNMLSEPCFPGGKEKAIKESGFRPTISSSTLILLLFEMSCVALEGYTARNFRVSHPCVPRVRISLTHMKMLGALPGCLCAVKPHKYECLLKPTSASIFPMLTMSYPKFSSCTRA